MGRVYYAEDVRLSQEVAIKETIAPKNEPPKIVAARVKAFQREAQLLAGKIKHHAVPRVIDYFQFGEHWYIVMDYVAGDSLETQLQKRSEPFPLDDVLRWADQLLEILASLHTGVPQVIHRDVKPSNIKVKNDRVYLLDFGLAKQLTGSKTSIPLFTLAFAPPEQMQNNEEPTAQGDLYSVGATMYCLLTKNEPADAYSRSFAIAGGGPDPLRHVKELRADLPDEIADLIMSALSIKPEHRPQSADAIRERLRAFLAKESQPSQEAAADPADKVKTLPYQPAINLSSSGAVRGEHGGDPSPANGGEQQPSVKTLVGALPPRFNGQAQSGPAERAPEPVKRRWRKVAAGLAFVGLAGLLGLGGYGYNKGRNRQPEPPPVPPRQIAFEKTQQAMERLYNNDYDGAKALSKEAIDKDPSYALAHAIHGDAFWDLDLSEIGFGDSSANPNTQISKGAILKIFADQEPATPEDFAARGWAFIASKKWDRAQQDVEKALAQKPDWAWALLQKAFVELGRGCVQEKDSKEILDAIGDLQKAHSVKPNYATLYLNLAGAYACNKQKPKALTAYEQALNLWPSPKTYLARGFFYIDSIDEKTKQQNIESARKDFAMSLEKSPSFGLAHLGLAQTHEIKEEYKECVAEAERALSKTPSFDGYYQRASCRLGLAAKEKDERGFEEALENTERAKDELNKYSVAEDEQKARARYFYLKSAIHHSKAYYYLTEKFLKNRNAANKKLVSGELENARSLAEQALNANKDKDLHKEIEKHKKGIEKNIRVFKRA